MHTKHMNVNVYKRRLFYRFEQIFTIKMNSNPIRISNTIEIRYMYSSNNSADKKIYIYINNIKTLLIY